MLDSYVAGILLAVLSLLFLARVIGQLLVVLFQPTWLPPMAQWYSGLIPYPILLAIQVVMLLGMGAIVGQFLAGEGYLVTRRPILGQFGVPLSILYFSAMIVRYVIRMSRHPDQRWFGGTIPIIFHCVLAAYLFTLSFYHLA